MCFEVSFLFAPVYQSSVLMAGHSHEAKRARKCISATSGCPARSSRLQLIWNKASVMHVVWTSGPLHLMDCSADAVLLCSNSLRCQLASALKQLSQRPNTSHNTQLWSALLTRMRLPILSLLTGKEMCWHLDSPYQENFQCLAPCPEREQIPGMWK